MLLEPVAVTKDNIKSTVLADDFVKRSEICTGRFEKFCTDAGI